MSIGLILLIISIFSSCDRHKSDVVAEDHDIVIVITDTIDVIGALRFMGYDRTSNQSFWYDVSANNMMYYDHNSRLTQKLEIDKNSFLYNESIVTFSRKNELLFVATPSRYGFYDIVNNRVMSYTRALMFTRLLA